MIKQLQQIETYSAVFIERFADVYHMFQIKHPTWLTDGLKERCRLHDTGIDGS